MPAEQVLATAPQGSRPRIEVSITTRIGEPPRYLMHWILGGLILVFLAISSHVAGISAPSEEPAETFDSFWGNGGGLLSLASVLVLLTGFLTTRQKASVIHSIEKDGLPEEIRKEDVEVSSPALRNCLLIASAIAFISCGANAVTTATHFWLYCTMLLPLLTIAVFFDFTSPTGWKGFAKFNEGNPVFRIILLFTIAGGIGGFGYHVISNEGRIMLPSVGYVGVYSKVSGPPPGEGESQASRPGAGQAGTASLDRSSAQGNAEPTLINRHVRGNNRDDALQNLRRSPNPDYIGLLDALFSGLLGDILIGMITANAIHLFVSGLMQYGREDDDDSVGPTNRDKRYFDRQSLTIISLGILSGFAGPRLLPDLAENFRKKQVEELRIERDEAKKEVLESKSLVDPIAKAKSEAQAIISKEIWPFLKSSSVIVTPKEPGAALSEFEAPVLAAIPEVAIVRVFRRITSKETVKQEELKNITRVVVPTDWNQDHNLVLDLLLGHYHSVNKSRKDAILCYDRVAGYADAPIKCLALMRRTWISGEDEKNELEAAETLFSEAITADMEATLDLVRMTIALLRAKEVMNPPLDLETATTVFYATALYNTARWGEIVPLLIANTDEEIQTKWGTRRGLVANTVKLAAEENAAKNPESLAALQKVKSERKGWDGSNADDKIKVVSEFLTPQVR